jgi:hypothetical protein
MSTLKEKIRYEGKTYNETTDQGKQAIEKMAARLQPWENDLLAHPKGTIEIKASGVLFLDSYPRELVDKVLPSKKD